MPGSQTPDSTGDLRARLDAALATANITDKQAVSVLDLLVPVVESYGRACETEGYERGRRDFQFAPEGDNHHNAALCPYCSPDRQPV